MISMHRALGSDRDVPVSTESDADLVYRAKQDTRAFAPLYERYQEGVLRYSYHCLGNWEDAADVTQQTFINALVGLAWFQNTNDSFRPWLFRIAHNEVINRHRQRARRVEQALQEADWVPDAQSSPEELALLRDDSAATYALVAKLTPVQRQCCALRFAGLSHREIATKLGKSEVAVRASYSRGISTLRTLLKDAGGWCDASLCD